MDARETADERDARAAARDSAADRRDEDWVPGETDHAAMDRLLAADDRREAGRDRERASQERGELEAAVEGRTVIGQAQGLLMARLGVSPQEAFSLLVAQSQHSQRRLREVAEDLVADHVRSTDRAPQRR